ncbi:MAG: PT domain-containing protein [Chloroflexota bacterium]|nr:PT domain-containing protein [Chloroflexota bacterium]
MKLINRGVRSVGVLALVVAGLGQISPAVAQTQAGFADAAFQRTWERTDRPVAEHTAADRSWYWGPTPGFATQEAYKQGVGGTRLVQYFDKSRMEINNPNGDKSSAFYVTNGLLANELMTGRMQVGDSDFEQRCAADVPLASDGDDANAPTYATFGKLLANDKGNLVGQKASGVVDRGGTVTVDASKGSDAGAALVYFESRTGRNIPKVFWDFLNASGPIYQNGQTVTGPLNQPWYFASGLPLTEAYWANVKIAGKATDVLIQAFERRILTYVPAYNGTPFAVQMGNVGQHYYAWRYKGVGCSGSVPGGPTAAPTAPVGQPTAAPTAAPVSCGDVPANQSATVEPHCGPVGTVFQVHITGFQPGEKVSFWITSPQGKVLGTPAPLDAGNHPGELDDIFDSSLLPLLSSTTEGNWALTYQGENTAHQAVAWFKIVPKTVGGGGGGGTGPTATPAPVSCDLSHAHDATVSPSSGRKGTIFAATITGFQPGEQASYWLTDPDGAVFGAQQQLAIPANGGGTLQLNSSVLYPGTWSLTVHGLRSGHESIAVFCVTP